MQKPVIFLATADPGFEALATDVILQTAHALRRARTVEGACQTLAAGGDDIALAVVDGDLRQDGRSLVEILGGCEERPYPILAIGGNEAVPGGAVMPLAKPVAGEDLRRHVEAICRLPAGGNPGRRRIGG